MSTLMMDSAPLAVLLILAVPVRESRMPERFAHRNSADFDIPQRHVSAAGASVQLSHSAPFGLQAILLKPLLEGELDGDYFALRAF